jgi:hypothetical protein
MTTAELQEARKELVRNERGTYSPDDFPGSGGWRRNKAAREALKAFDAAHPEILAGIKAARATREAEQNAYWNSPAGIEKQLSM